MQEHDGRADLSWHFTDHKDIQSWLEQLLARRETNSTDTTLLKNALKGIERDNKERGF
jgi:O-methyltransferase involved in polyketide biosynthesis